MQYTIWRWIHTRDATASGDTHDAFWPETNLAEDEREGSPRSERYTFTVTDKKENTAVWRADEADWRTIKVNDQLSISTHRGSGESWIVDEKGNKLIRVYQR